MISWVIKVGGSLFPNAAINLINDLIDYANHNSDFNENILIINGGGEFANLIRKYDSEISLPDITAHETAIISMDIIGKLLASKIDNLIEVNNIEDALKVVNENSEDIGLNNYKIPILISSNFIINNSNSNDGNISSNSDVNSNNDVPFGASWDITSDSIAAYIAHIIGANLLIATDVDGIHNITDSNTNDKLYGNVGRFNSSNLIDEITASELMNFSETSVDLRLAKMLIDYEMDCIVVNGNFSDRIISIIENHGANCINSTKIPFTLIYNE
ncbi:MAG: delta 1-pyrroline-5-carboxylate synthetase [Methanobacteriaceae archaeon]